MTFAALLTKELRLRLRRERAVWLIIIYLLVMGLLGMLFLFFILAQQQNYNAYALSQAGLELYILLSVVQLILTVFFTPAFTSTTINGEKERQTFDLLLCSRLSAFSLISGKLVAGLANALLLVASAIPLFSLVFFFGGITMNEFLKTILVYTDTIFVTGSFGLLCSTLIKRPAVSTVLAYLFCVVWLLAPWLIYFMWLAFGGGYQNGTTASLILQWMQLTPIGALFATFPPPISGGFTSISLAGLNLRPWITYSGLSLIITCIFVFLSMWLVKPNALGRLRQMRNPTPKNRSNDVVFETVPKA